jgi:hypothetical protein
MTTEKAVLSTFKEVVNHVDLTYVEKVKIHYLGEQWFTFLAISDHTIFLVNPNVKSLIDGGELFYAHIVRAVVDTNADDIFLLYLHDNRPAEWSSPNLIVQAEHRERLLSYIAASWQADYMWRFGAVELFPAHRKALSPERQPMRVRPPSGLIEGRFSGYSFWLKDDYKEIDEGIGVYRNKMGVEAHVEVCLPVECSTLWRNKSEHVRFKALEARMGHCGQLRNFYVLLDTSYNKRMNLVDDKCEWSGWEFLIRSEDTCQACVVLRRSFMPPLCDSVQDIIIFITCPARFVNEWKITMDQLLHEARMAADSLSSSPLQPTMYMKMIQVKLDTLSVSQSVYGFLQNTFNMRSAHEVSARKLVKSLVIQLANESVIALTDELASMLGKDTAGQDPLPPVLAETQSWMMQQLLLDEDSMTVKDQCRWYIRFSDYLTYCLEGGLFGNLFTMATVIEALKSSISPQLEANIRALLRFMLHWRSQDLTVPFKSQVLSSFCVSNICCTSGPTV